MSRQPWGQARAKPNGMHVVSVEMTPALWQALWAEAKRDDRSVASVVRTALKRYLLLLEDHNDS